MIFLNFKTYKNGTGEMAQTMVKVAESVEEETGVKVVCCVQPTDLKSGLWSQKIDSVEYGAHTGSVLAESVIGCGAVGTLLNHSENRSVNFEDLAKAHNRAKEVGLKTLIFAKDLEELEMVAGLKPDYISYEPPSLIGSSDISVATAEPDIIAKAAIISKKYNIPLIVGAGVHSKDDVKKCIELGAFGVAVASDVMKADDPKKELLDLAIGFR